MVGTVKYGSDKYREFARSAPDQRYWPKPLSDPTVAGAGFSTRCPLFPPAARSRRGANPVMGYLKLRRMRAAGVEHAYDRQRRCGRECRRHVDDAGR